ncbi:MAG: hypothetical protein KIS92_03365 [Planctomycetota bacterium]|nr:hypothetical protein [Planctomycetota bacterium]
MSNAALALRPVAFEVRLRNTRTRMPFRYGPTVLTACPIAHLWLTVEGPGGARVEGLAGDALAPGWYDKRPNRTYRQDIAELSAALNEAGSVLLGLAKAGPRCVWDFWKELYAHQIAWARKNDYTDLTGNFGTTMFERAMIDAAGKLAGKTYHALVKENLLGLDPGAIHPWLKGWSAAEALAPEPLSRVYVRHTVGGLDPLTAADIPAGEAVRDGLPHSFEDYLKHEKIRYFKIKLRNDEAFDTERLKAIAALCDRHIPAQEPYYVTLDGNEVYYDPASLTQAVEKFARGGLPKRFWDAVLFIEQPYPRAKALEDAIMPELAKVGAIKPVIVDESTENLQSVPRAVELGYGGFAIKSAKGPTKAILEKGTMFLHPKRPARPVISGEDMTNQPVVPLHEDLVVMATMGVEHVERNGHHFFRGFSTHSQAERDAALKHHAGLYRLHSDGIPVLATESGALDLRTLIVRPGLGVQSAEVDKTALTPLDGWTFESLGIK